LAGKTLRGCWQPANSRNVWHALVLNGRLSNDASAERVTA